MPINGNISQTHNKKPSLVIEGKPRDAYAYFTRVVTDRQTDGHNYNTQDRANITSRRILSTKTALGHALRG